METSDWLFIGATIVGPVLAVLATRLVDYFREKSSRRYNIFVALMTTRAYRLNHQHIEALNRVEVEFSDSRDIISALRRYMDLLDDSTPKDSDNVTLLGKRRNRAFAELVQAIGVKLRRRVDKLDLTEGGYYPTGLAELEDLQKDNAQQLNIVLKGSRPLWIAAAPNPTQTSTPEDRGPFPPRPPRDPA